MWSQVWMVFELNNVNREEWNKYDNIYKDIQIRLSNGSNFLSTVRASWRANGIVSRDIQTSVKFQRAILKYGKRSLVVDMFKRVFWIDCCLNRVNRGNGGNRINRINRVNRIKIANPTV